MSDLTLPEGYRWSWRGGTVRIHLPAMEFDGARQYEPVLSRRDAERIAGAIGERMLGGSPGREVSTPAVAPARVQLARDPRYSASAMAEFRAWLGVALAENGIDFPLGETNATAVIEFGADPDEPPAPPPPPPPFAPRLPGPPGGERSGFRPPTWRRRFGKGRGR